MESIKAELKNEIEWVEMQIEHLVGKAEQQLLYALEWEEYEQKCREEIMRLKHEITNSETDLDSFNAARRRIKELDKRKTEAIASSICCENLADEYFYFAKKYEKQRNRMLKDYEGDNFYVLGYKHKCDEERVRLQAVIYGNREKYRKKYSTVLADGFMRGCE